MANGEPSGEIWTLEEVQAGWRCYRIDFEIHDTDAVLFSGPNAESLAKQFMDTYAPASGTEGPASG